jgi:hypothetical protein
MRSAALVLTSLVSACYSYPHARLQPPAPGASAVERQWAYEVLRPRDSGAEPPLPHPHRRTSATDYLVLRNGQRVYRPGDLRAVVPPDSATARAARRHERAQERSRLWLYVAGGLGVAGAGLVTSDVVGDNDGLGEIGIGLVGAGLVAALVGGLYYFPRIRREREAAFETYDQDLRRRLALCVDGLAIVACDSGGQHIE